MPYSDDQALGALEAILLVSGRAVTEDELGAALALTEREVSDLLGTLAAQYAGEGGGRRHGFCLRRGATGWRLYADPLYDEAVGRFIVGSHPAKLTPAALETLAIVAYRQPVTRAQIASIRGVSVDGVVRTLLAHDLIEEAGQTPTGALTYRTTPTFMEKMGLSDLDELPPLAPYLPTNDQLEAIDSEVEG